MKITRLKTVEMRAAGLDAMTKTQDTPLDETEAVAVCSLGWRCAKGCMRAAPRRTIKRRGSCAQSGQRIWLAKSAGRSRGMGDAGAVDEFDTAIQIPTLTTSLPAVKSVPPSQLA